MKVIPLQKGSPTRAAQVIVHTQIVTPQRSQGHLQQCHPPHRPGAEDLPRGVGTSAYGLQVKERVGLDLGHALWSVGPVISDSQQTLVKGENRNASSSGSTCDIWGHRSGQPHRGRREDRQHLQARGLRPRDRFALCPESHPCTTQQPLMPDAGPRS